MKSDYDKYYIVPTGTSFVDSRSDVSLQTPEGYTAPIIISPMANITGADLVISAGSLGYLAILHRFFKSNVDRIEAIKRVKESGVKYGVAVGTTEDELEYVEYAMSDNLDVICIDVANGYSSKLASVISNVRKISTGKQIMCGNVVSKEGFKFLENCGVDYIRVGIGSGNLCTTRQVTGIGRNTLDAISDIIEDCDDARIVADGGIRTSGDIVKCLAFGADYVMIGSLAARALESENYLNGTHKIYGMASLTNHLSTKKEVKSIEGREETLDVDSYLPLGKILNSLCWGIRSACTYLNSSSYKDMYFRSKSEVA